MAQSIQTSVSSSSSETVNQKYLIPLMILTTLFFMWGFITCMNDILIPFLKKVFILGRFESMFVQFAFFGAYFVGSVIYFWISAKFGDPISKIGYKNGIIYGLIISALGCGMFIPATVFQIYGLFLVALFILGLGFTLLQIAANPYVAILGTQQTASSRLNLAQAFNSFGTAIAPILGGYLVFHFFATTGNPLMNIEGNPVIADSGSPLSANSVIIPYLIFCSVFLLLSVVFKFMNLPRFSNSSTIEKGAGALKYSHLVFGMIAIFMYVGGEVSIGSVLINFMKESVGFPEMEAKSYLAFYWGGAMIGRFLGAISLSSKPWTTKMMSMTVVSAATFLFLYFAVFIESGFTFSFVNVAPFILFLVLNLIGFAVGRSMAHTTLMVFSFIAIGLLITALLTSGLVALWAIIGIGLFNSIMWSNIFTLAIKDLGKYTAQGSSLLVMMILGGALLPLIQGAVGDAMGGYHYSFFIPIFSYLYLAFYGWKGHVVKQKVDDKMVS